VVVNGKRPLPNCDILHSVLVHRQGERPAPSALPLAVGPDEQSKELCRAQIAALALQLLGRPVAVVLAGAQRPAGQEFGGLPVSAMAIGILDQLQDLVLQPSATRAANPAARGGRERSPSRAGSARIAGRRESAARRCLPTLAP